jgi:hypothetical protein
MLEAFEAKVRSFPEVLECNLITGRDADYQLKVVVPDMEAYQRFLLEKLTRIEGESKWRRRFGPAALRSRSLSSARSNDRATVRGLPPAVPLASGRGRSRRDSSSDSLRLGARQRSLSS